MGDELSEGEGEGEWSPWHGEDEATLTALIDLNTVFSHKVEEHMNQQGCSVCRPLELIQARLSNLYLY
jgi:hypothetical protein